MRNRRRPSLLRKRCVPWYTQRRRIKLHRVRKLAHRRLAYFLALSL